MTTVKAENSDTEGATGATLPTPPPEPTVKKQAKAKVPRIKREPTPASSAEDQNPEQEDENHEEEQPEDAPPEKKVKREKTNKPAAIKKEEKPKGKRGRAAGTATFTTEQDHYIIQLRKEGKKNQEVHQLFEERFATGKTPKSIENRYFQIKDEALLSAHEENLLDQVIEEITKDISGAIISRFKELNSGKSVTKGFVMKKLKKKELK